MNTRKDSQCRASGTWVHHCSRCSVTLNTLKLEHHDRECSAEAGSVWLILDGAGGVHPANAHPPRPTTERAVHAVGDEGCIITYRGVLAVERGPVGLHSVKKIIQPVERVDSPPRRLNAHR